MALQVPFSYNCPEQNYHFEEDLLAAAMQLRISEEELKGRRSVNGFTVDHPDSPDLDDAIWLEKEGNTTVVSVSISDVDSFVKPESSIDQAAFFRASSFYSQHRVLAPMLPKILSEWELSLVSRQPRPTITVRITLDENGFMTDVQILKSMLISQERMTYGLLNYRLQSPKSRHLYEEYERLALQLFQRRNKRKLSRLLEQEGELSPEEIPSDLTDPLYEKSMSERIIEEFMILANRAVAEFADGHGLPILYRNHGSDALDLYPQLSSERRRLMEKRAWYSPRPGDHESLAVDRYTHFTSPIRRYADLITHRVIKALIAEEEIPYTDRDLEHISRHLNTVSLHEEAVLRAISRARRKTRENVHKALTTKKKKKRKKKQLPPTVRLEFSNKRDPFTPQLLQFCHLIGIPFPEYHFRTSQQQYSCSVSWDYLDQSWVVEGAPRTQKKTALKSASEALLATISKWNPFVGRLIRTPGLTSKIFKVIEAPLRVGHFRTALQALHQEIPVHEEPEFQFVDNMNICTMRLRDGTLVQAESSKKKQALNLACQKALIQLGLLNRESLIVNT